MESLSIIATPGIAMASPSYRAHCVVSKSMARSAFISGTPLHFQYPLCPLYTASRSVRAFNTAAAILSQIEEVEKEGSPKEAPNPLTPTSFEVQSLLMEVCDETSIAELELTVGAFKLHVKRDVAKLKGSAPPVPVAPPVPSKPMVESVTANISPPVVAASAPKTPLLSVAEILANPASKSGSRFGLLEAAADEGLLFVTSPKVGLFRRSRVVKGKSGRPLCEEGQNVKEGQVVCYVEQLGTQQPVEAENSGEVMKILCEDGEPVGYGDPLIAIRPSFPGIK